MPFTGYKEYPPARVSRSRPLFLLNVIQSSFFVNHSGLCLPSVGRPLPTTSRRVGGTLSVRGSVSLRLMAAKISGMDQPDRAGLDSSAYGTHSLLRTKPAQIYKKIGNPRAVQLLLGHTKLENTVRYLGIEVDDVLIISEQVEL